MTRTLLVGIAAFLHLAQTGLALDPVTENLFHFRNLLPGVKTGGIPVEQLDWASLPPKVDMRREMEDLQLNFVQQGSRNSCAAFSATSVLEFQQRRLGNDIDISEQYTLWAAQKAGGTPHLGLTIPQLAMAFHLYKVCSEEAMPYKSSDIIIEPTDLAIEDARKMPAVVTEHVVQSSGRIGQTPEEIFRICKTLAKNQPVCLASEWADPERALNQNNELQEAPMSGFHMIVLTGYELSPTNPMQGHFLLRNSWGMNWGDFGYAKMPFSFAQKHASDAVTFRFKWTEVSSTSDGKTTTPSVDVEVADSFGSYIMQRALIGLIAALLAIYSTCWIIGKQVRTFRSVLLFLLVSLLYYLPLVWMSAVLVRGLGSRLWMGVLAVSFISLLARWCKVAAERFQITNERAVGFLVVAMVLWNTLGWAGNTFMPMASFKVWKSAVPSMSPLDALELVTGTTEHRVAFLEVTQVGPKTQTESLQAGDKNWLLGWAEELRQEQRLLRRDHPTARYHFKQRVASYEKQRKAFAVKTAGATLLGGPSKSATAEPSPAKASRDRELLKMFNELKKERAALDTANASAVAKYNQKAALYKAKRLAAASAPKASKSVD
ncbi:MAG TPA: C1 family peptidase [Chthoniobacterales bacterium]